MTATEMHDLLRDSLAAFREQGIWKTGDTFVHIQYCKYCHYNQTIGHGEQCVIARLERATQE